MLFFRNMLLKNTQKMLKNQRVDQMPGGFLCFGIQGNDMLVKEAPKDVLNRRETHEVIYVELIEESLITKLKFLSFFTFFKNFNVI